MIIDAFLFNNELDMLKIRINELYDVVDKFVVIEAPWTFRGKKKNITLNPWLIRDQFNGFSDKIISTYNYDDPYDGLEGYDIPWKRETYQRNLINNYLDDVAEPDDIVIVSDVDEIPRASVFDQIAKVDQVTTLTMDMYYCRLNFYDGKWGGAKAVKYKNMKTAQETRHTFTEKSIDNAGWHFSYMGDPEFICNKIKSFSHSELDTPDIVNTQNIRRRINNQEDIWGHGKKYQIVDIDETYPKYITDNMRYFEKYIYRKDKK